MSRCSFVLIEGLVCVTGQFRSFRRIGIGAKLAMDVGMSHPQPSVTASANLDLLTFVGT